MCPLSDFIPYSQFTLFPEPPFCHSCTSFALTKLLFMDQRWTRSFAWRHIWLLLCTCKPLGRARFFLLLLKVTSFHPSPSSEVALTLRLGVDTACFSAAVQVQGYSSCCISEKIPPSQVLHSLLSSFCNSSTWWHSSSQAAQLLQDRRPSLLAERGPRHSCSLGVVGLHQPSKAQPVTTPLPYQGQTPKCFLRKLLYHVSPAKLST